MNTSASLRQTNKARCEFCDTWLIAAHVKPRLDMSVRKEQTLIPHEHVAHLGKCFCLFNHSMIQVGVIYPPAFCSYLILWFFSLVAMPLVGSRVAMLAMCCDLTPGVLVRALSRSVTGAHQLHCYNRSTGIFNRINK